MPVHIKIEGRSVRCNTEVISIGRAQTNQISLPNEPHLARVQAVLRRVSGRWIVESQSSRLIRVGNGRPIQLAWLNPGDVIHLTESGPALTFQPDIPATEVSQNANSDTLSVARHVAKSHIQLSETLSISSDDMPHPQQASTLPYWYLFAGVNGLAILVFACVGLSLFGGGRTHSESIKEVKTNIPENETLPVGTFISPLFLVRGAHQ